MKIAAIAGDAAALARIGQALQGSGDAASLTLLEAGRAELASPENSLGRFDLLIVDGAGALRADLPALEALTRRNPKLLVLLLAAQSSAELLMQAMRAGVREVLPWPAPPAELCNAVARARVRLASPVAREPGKILAFVPCKGGSGATFLATNLGFALANDQNKKVLLIDLDLQHGDASFFLSGEPARTSITEVAKQSERLDAAMLSSSCIEITPNFSLLAAPEDLEQAVSMQPEQIERVLALAVQLYDFVILDIDHSIDALTIKAFDRADLIFTITQLMVAYVRNTKKLLHLFTSLGYGERKIRLIGNRAHAKTDLPTTQVEAVVGAPLFRVIPNDFDAASTSTSLGLSILRHAPGSPLSKAVKELAVELAGAAPEPGSWLSKLFHRSSRASGAGE